MMFITVLAWVIFVAITIAFLAVGATYWLMTPWERKGAKFSVSSWTLVAWAVSFSWIVSRYL